jgi:dTDP-4-dehydrorhamnose reductase
MSPRGPLAAAGERLRVGVLGAAGQVGRCLVRAIAAAPDLELAFAVTRAEVDLAEPEAFAPWVDRQASRPDVVVNAAAFTKVDACESQVDLARRLNAQGARRMGGGAVCARDRLRAPLDGLRLPG